MSIFKLKLVVLGMAGVGKTNIIQRFLKDEFITNFKLTIGIDIYTKYFEYEKGKIVLLSIWDIAGQSRFEDIRKTFYNNADGAIIVFNPFDMASYSKAKQLVDEIRDFIGDEIPFVLIGNKIQLTNEFENIIDRANILDFIYNEDGFYIEVSPNSEANIDLAFKELIQRIVNSSR
ncbi:MAG: Rab family GTPase [Promethearchaeota archaeon]